VPVCRLRRKTGDYRNDPGFCLSTNALEKSGGELLDESTLKETVKRLSEAVAIEANAPPIIKRKSAWDRTLIFYLLFGILGMEWFLRCRWGMV